MAIYLFKRLAFSLIALLLVSVAVFLMGRATGDPVGLLAGPAATPEQEARISSALGLDEPLHVQYGIFLQDLTRGSLGDSVRTRRPVESLIADRLPASVYLASSAMMIVVVIGIPLGVLAATRRGQRIDSTARGLALVGQSAPSFVVGIIFIQVFAVNLGWLPASGAGSARHYVLPATALSLFVLAGIVRLVRSSMLEVLDSEYIKLARLKGAKESTVVWRHALRNALIPVVTFAGMYFSILITLAIVIEVVFSWPGVGRMTFDAIIFRDFPVLQGVILVSVLIIMLVNLAIDLLYAVIDPRVRATSGGA